MTDETYMSWINYETWNAYLWMSNDEPTYRHVSALLETARNYGRDAGEDMRELFSDIWGDATPDGASISRVHWQDITEAFNG